MSCVAPMTLISDSSEEPSPRPMTRCECSGVSFSQVAERVACEGVSVEDVMRRTGCGRTCTACVPDLQRFLNQV